MISIKVNGNQNNATPEISLELYIFYNLKNTDDTKENIMQYEKIIRGRFKSLVLFW